MIRIPSSICGLRNVSVVSFFSITTLIATPTRSANNTNPKRKRGQQTPPLQPQRKYQRPTPTRSASEDNKPSTSTTTDVPATNTNPKRKRGQQTSTSTTTDVPATNTNPEAQARTTNPPTSTTTEVSATNTNPKRKRGQQTLHFNHNGSTSDQHQPEAQARTTNPPLQPQRKYQRPTPTRSASEDNKPSTSTTTEVPATNTNPKRKRGQKTNSARPCSRYRLAWHSSQVVATWREGSNSPQENIGHP